MSRSPLSPDSSFPLSSPTSFRTQNLPLRPASGVTQFVGTRAAKKRGFSSLSSEAPPRALSMSPQPSQQVVDPLIDHHHRSYHDQFHHPDDPSDVTAVRIGRQYSGSPQPTLPRRSRSRVSESPPISSQRDLAPQIPRMKTPTRNMFDSDSTVAFSDTTTTPRQPLPSQNALPPIHSRSQFSRLPGPWEENKEQKSNTYSDEVEVLTQEPAIFSSRRVQTSDSPEYGEGSEGNEIDNRDGGSQEIYENESEEQDHDRLQQEGPQEYFDESEDFDDRTSQLADQGEEEGGFDEEQGGTDGDGSWDEKFQEPGLSRQEENDILQEPPRQSHGLFTFDPNRPTFMGAGVNPRASDPQQRIAKQAEDPDRHRTMTTHERGARPHSQTPKIQEGNDVATSGSQRYTSAFEQPGFDRPLLSNEELEKIDSLDELLAAMSSKRQSTRAPSLPSDKLEYELNSLANYSYPNRDEAKAREFFMKLPDSTYDKAGEIIASKKREIEDELLEQAAKRRKLYAEKEIEAEKLAEVRVKRLRRLSETQEKLKDGVASLLQKVGLKL